jgi:hypothetical protein
MRTAPEVVVVRATATDQAVAARGEGQPPLSRRLRFVPCRSDIAAFMAPEQSPDCS